MFYLCAIIFNRQAWDLAVDQCLSQLPDIIKDESQYKVTFYLHFDLILYRPVFTDQSFKLI